MIASTTTARITTKFGLGDAQDPPAHGREISVAPVPREHLLWCLFMKVMAVKFNADSQV